MNKIIRFVIFFIVLSFFGFSLNYYVSDKNINTVKNNRENLESKILLNTSVLPLLPNDTNDVIEFNSGFDNSDKQNFKKFWELLNKDDKKAIIISLSGYKLTKVKKIFWKISTLGCNTFRGNIKIFSVKKVNLIN